jgi:hypothetical protein
LIPWVEEPVMFTPEVVVAMPMAVTLVTGGDLRFSIPDRSGHLFGRTSSLSYY